MDLAGLLEGPGLGEPDAIPRHYKAVILDCQSAIDLQPSYAKAYLRKAQALHALERNSEALQTTEEGCRHASGPLKQEMTQLVRTIENAVAKQQQQAAEQSKSHGASNGNLTSNSHPAISQQQHQQHVRSQNGAGNSAAASTNDFLTSLATAGSDRHLAEEYVSDVGTANGSANNLKSKAPTRSVGAKVQGNSGDYGGVATASKAAAPAVAHGAEDTLDLDGMD